MPVKTRFSVIIISVLVLVVGVVIIFAGFIWFQNKIKRVDAGTARRAFPYADYSQEELEKLYPQYPNADVQTTQSPEETHQKFISALRQGNFDEAVKCCFFEKDWEEMNRILKEVKEGKKLDMMIGDLSDISKDTVLDTRATYIYSGTSGGEKVGRFLEFVKDEKGVWRITSL